MKVSVSTPVLAAALVTFAAMGFASASAQQISYPNPNDFLTPATNSQDSYNCAANPALFCFNYQGSTQDPIFINTTTPDPWVVQMTYPQTSQASSMWFSVPQKVQQGFNVWFQFQITPAPGTYTADGIAFVLQNAKGGSTDTAANCTETGSGPTVVGGPGGCIGYGGIDNSLALEFDTYQNGWDPTDISTSSSFTYNDNHVALESCGPGEPNSPSHANCALTLANSPAPTSTLISNPRSSADGKTTITLADGNPHQVVIVYNGPNDSPANWIYVYLDPTYNTGTLTPDAASLLHPIFSGPFDITTHMNLLNGDSAYVGFTSATGAAYETHDILAWTFTPHTTVSQQQPLNNPGSPTTFDFGTHSYTVTYPSSSDTSGTGMGVIANTISPGNFVKLLGTTSGANQYTGSQCQVYDDTGGNCIIYSVYCYDTGSGTIKACPAAPGPPTDCADPAATDCINLLSAYNNSVQPTSPGYLKGDPLYSPVTSVTWNGTTATVTCTGECAVTQGQTVTILDTTDTPQFTGITVGSILAPNQFTFTQSPAGNPLSGGFITSNNVEDIFQLYSSGNNDGSSAGKIPSYSDFVVTGTTTVGSQTSLAAPATPVLDNQAITLTATITIPTTGPSGLTLLSAQGTSNPALPGTTVSGTVSFADTSSFLGTSCQGLSLGSPVTVTTSSITYQVTCSYQPTSTGQDTVTATYSGDPYHDGSSGPQTFTVQPQTVQVTVSTMPANLTYDVNGSPSSGSQLFTWNVGSNNTLFAPSPQSGSPGTQYVFSSWSNGPTTAMQTVQAPLTPTTYTANFTTQYLLSAAAGTGGSVTVAGGYYNAGSMQPILATPNSGYAFSGWTGSSDIANTAAASTTITMNRTESITANFTPIPLASVTPPSINFGTLYLGDLVSQSVTVSNRGAAPMTISDPLIAILPGSNGALSEFGTLNLCPKTLGVGKSCTMLVAFVAGPFYGPQSASLTINTNGPGSITVPLSATVINPQARLSTTALNFGTVKTNTASTKSITVSNTGATLLSVTGVAISGDTTDFFIAANGCSSVLPGKSCVVQVTFQPTAKTSDAGALVITDNAKNSPQTVSLTGRGN